MQLRELLPDCVNPEDTVRRQTPVPSAMPTPQPEAEAAIALLPPFLAARRPTAGHQCARRPRRAPLALHAHDRRPIARPRRRHLRGRPATVVRDLHDRRGREVVSSHGAGRGRCSPCVSGPWTLHHLQDHQPAEHPKRDTTSETTWDRHCLPLLRIRRRTPPRWHCLRMYTPMHEENWLTG